MAKGVDTEKQNKQMVAEAIGRAIRHYRELQDMSQSNVYNKINIERNVFQRYDSGKVSSPKIINLIKIAEALDINAGDIINKAHEFLKENPKFEL